MFEMYNDLIGKTMKRVEASVGGDVMLLEAETGEIYRFYHSQDCCESVSIDDIVGDLDDLVGSPIIMAEEVSNEGAGPLSEWTDSYTWTFYKFATEKGYVTVKWYGTSNGYYSESVSFEKL